MDPDGIHQVLMNLLSNALDAVEDGKGLIKINGAYDAEQRQVVIEVSDNGWAFPRRSCRIFLSCSTRPRGTAERGWGWRLRGR